MVFLLESVMLESGARASGTDTGAGGVRNRAGHVHQGQGRGQGHQGLFEFWFAYIGSRSRCSEVESVVFSSIAMIRQCDVWFEYLESQSKCSKVESDVSSIC